jgi:hypothetical protein
LRRILVYGEALAHEWRLAYYGNPNLAGHPGRTDRTDAIDFNWADGRPGPGLPADGFSLRAEGYLLANQTGIHALRVQARGSARVWVGGRMLLNGWESPEIDELIEIDLDQGLHFAVLEYRDPGGLASIKLTWTSDDGASTTATPTGQATGTMTPPSPTPRSSAGPPGTRRIINLPMLLTGWSLRETANTRESAGLEVGANSSRQDHYVNDAD